ncbi:MAG: type II toxin-antitoxin system MqsA family antitoxin [Deltaproteobacteria bacterium]|nr:MAG: type II toxin-antitoxin system MqsA family antitoxin [Deltaproteobacteria bacterium]
MTARANTCPICGEGRLREQVGTNRVAYRDQSTELELHYSVCDSCGSEQSDAAQLRANKRAMVAFKKKVDGLLSGEEVRRIRERLGLSQAEAARVFGGGPVAFSKYESNDVAQSEAMDKLLRLAAEVPEAFCYLRRMAGFAETNVAVWASMPNVASQKASRHLRLISTSGPAGQQDWRKSA